MITVLQFGVVTRCALPLIADKVGIDGILFELQHRNQLVFKNVGLFIKPTVGHNWEGA